MKKNIFLLATASLLVAASCGKDDNGGANGGASTGCWSCTKTITFVNELPRVSTSTHCNLTSSDAKALEAAHTTSSATMTSTMSCSMQ